MRGAIVGGLPIGVVHSHSAVFLPAELQNLTLFVVFLATLIIRPTGLFGRYELAGSPDQVVPGHDPLVMERFKAPFEAVQGSIVQIA